MKPLRLDVVSFLIDIALNRVDSLCQYIDAKFFAGVSLFAIASEQADPVLAVGFDVFGKVRIVGESRGEEVGVRRNIYLIFGFSDDLAGEIVLGVVVLIIVVPFFVEAERERIGGTV